jgi:replication factor C subunit 3/5
MSELISLNIDNRERNLPWIEKYRPSTIKQIISHHEIIHSLTNLIKMNAFPHLLFFGPSGCGKTSTIICCANMIYGNHAACMVLHLNASNERGIDTVRTKIKNFVINKNSTFLPSNMKNIIKLVILDEIDSMTVEAQGMLRQTIEKNSNSTRFCLICNDIDKINIALQSRCTLFRFSTLDKESMKKRLLQISELENIEIDTKAINVIIKLSEGDMRAAINILQQAKLSCNKNITSETIYKISGFCTPNVIKECFQILLDTYEHKKNLQKSIKKLMDIITNNNITIANLLNELVNNVLKHSFHINQKIYLLDHMAKIEKYDSDNVDCFVLVSILVSLFFLLKSIH